MKRRFVFFVGLVLLLMSSCQDGIMDNRCGEVIMFKVSAENDIRTKTAFSGEAYGGIERIDWLENDQVDLYQYNWNSKSLEPNNKIIYTVVGIREEEEKSVGGLQGETPFVWGTGSYEFYSVYPVDAGKLSGLGSTPTFSFTLPSSQYWDLSENMKHNAYMAAVSSKKNNTSSDTEKVSLEYYPMVTTLYVTVTNNTQSNVDLNSIKLSSTSRNDGKYYADVLTGLEYEAKLEDGQRRFVTTDQTDQNKAQWTPNEIILQPASVVTLKPGDSQSVAFFIRPIQYQARALRLTINTSKITIDRSLDYGINSDKITYLEPCKKYNVHIKLTEKSGPSLSDSDISTGLAEMLSLLISKELGSSFSSYFPNLDWNNFRNSTINNWGKFDGASFKKLFKDYLDIIQELLGTVKDLGPFSEAQIDTPITPNDFTFLPNLENINLQTHSTITIANLQKLKTASFQYASSVTVTNCDSLTQIHFENSTDLKSIDIENCASLSTFYGDNGGALESLKLINTPNFTGGKIDNVSSNGVNVTLNNCSTYIEGNATIDLGGKGKVTERINSSNVDVN